MINNQNEFNNTYNNKEVKEIEIKRNRNFQGELIIDDYSELESLNLRDIKSIDKITLKNLSQLQECTIWNCGVKDLIITNCSQIKRLNVRRNSLANSEFLKNLDNLETLEWDGNTQLSEILEPYKGDWKAYRENLQKLISLDKDLTKENLQELLRLQGENKKLRNDLEFSQQKYSILKKALVSFSREMQEQIKEQEIIELDNEIKKAEIKTQELIVLKTEELVLSTQLDIKKLKKLKVEREIELRELKSKIYELEKELAEAKTRAEERGKKIEELNKLVLTTKEQTSKTQSLIYEKTFDFLRAKSIFLNARRETIEELQKCFNKWDKFGRRNAVVGEIGSTISNVGGDASSTTIFGVIPKTLGEIIKSGSNFSRIAISEKGSKEFQIILTNEEELINLNNVYDSLIELIWENEETNNILGLVRTRRLRNGKAELFSKKHEIYDILINDGVWKERYLSLEKMGEATTSLNQNLREELEPEWEEQFDKLKLKISKKYGELFLKEQNIQTKIQQLKSNLNGLTNSAKDKLKSKKLLSTEERKKRNKEREEMLDSLLNVQAEIVRLGDSSSDKKIEKQEKLDSLKKGLLEISIRHGHKEFEKELDKIYQTQIKLVKLQIELEKLQNKQQEAKILSPASPTTQSNWGNS